MTHIDMNFFSDALCRRQRLRVLLPEPAAEVPQDGLAVLYLLHGFSDGCDSVLYNSAFARYCEGLPLCVVMPDAEKSFYTDMRYGNAYWTHIQREVPALVQKLLPVSAAAQKTFLGGISMGGYGAAKWMLQAPESCAQVFLISPVTDIVRLMQQGFTKLPDFTAQQFQLDCIFDEATIAGSENDLYALLAAQEKPLAPVSLYCGEQDFLQEEVREFAAVLRQKNALVRDVQTPGEHCWQTWEQYLEDVAQTLRKKLL